MKVRQTAHAPAPTTQRCAIYTRKSSSEGLQNEFTSLDAQRGACESYIASQAGEGWIALASRYDDGGFSGGSLNRPALTRLMLDVAAGHIDIVVVYKIDRLSRSLIDFAALLGGLEKQGAGFVAVTQSFDSTSSMGRLTLNVLLSFAQFERELASERIRDKAAASRAIGRWWGPRPFGYSVEKGMLIIDAEEARIVRYAYRHYPAVGSARLLAQSMTEKGYRNRDGGPFSQSCVTRMLRSRLYRGDLVHRGKPIPGVHEPIVAEAAWTRVRTAMDVVTRRHRAPKHSRVPNPFKGLLFDAWGEPIRQDFCYGRNGVHRYYIPSGRRAHGVGRNAGPRYRAAEIDAAVLSAVEGVMPRLVRIEDTARRSAAVIAFVTRIDIGERSMLITLQGGAQIETDAIGRVRAIATRLP